MYLSKVIIHKPRGKVSLVEKIENVYFSASFSATFSVDNTIFKKNQKLLRYTYIFPTLTDGIFETGACRVPSKSQHPKIWVKVVYYISPDKNFELISKFNQKSTYL